MSIGFITLTNTGYIDYTLNCLKSLENIDFKKPLHCHCIGVDGYNILKDNGYESSLINDETYRNFEDYGIGKYSTLMYYKILIIYENLLKYDYVCYTDGDVVFENNQFLDYLVRNIENNDILIQNDYMSDSDQGMLCAGFMFIRSNQKTRELLNPKHVEKYKYIQGWQDQLYINKILDKTSIMKVNLHNKLKYRSLPLALYPNGGYYYKNHSTLKSYIIHFNWIGGTEKKSKMQELRKWYLDSIIL